MTHSVTIAAALFGLGCTPELSECEVYKEAVCECESEAGAEACASARDQITIAEAQKEDGWTNLYRDAQSVCGEEYEIFMEMGGCGALSLQSVENEDGDGASTGDTD